MALRVARGLFRLWLVLSVLWIGGVATMTWWTWPVDICVTPPGGPHACDENDVIGVGPNFDPPTKEANPPPSGFVIDKPQFDPSKPYRLPHDEQRHAAIRFAGLLAFAPPVLVLALGSALVWAFRGISIIEPKDYQNGFEPRTFSSLGRGQSNLVFWVVGVRMDNM
jgi:hypothetical protein